MRYRVFGERILVQRDVKKEATSHIMMPTNVEKKPCVGTILCVGDKVKCVKEGERVYFNEYAGYFLETTQDLEESDLIVMREDEILAIEDLEDDIS